MSKLICVDNHVLIWGVRGVASPDQEEKIAHAKAVIEQLLKQKAKVAIPSPVLSELIAPIEEDHVAERIVVELNKGFRVLPFDTLSAVKTGRLINKHQSNWRRDFNPDNLEAGWKTRFKYDMLIIGICLAYDVDALITEDKRLTKYAKKEGITVHALTAYGYQTKLSLEDEEIASVSPTDSGPEDNP